MIDSIRFIHSSIRFDGLMIESINQSIIIQYCHQSSSYQVPFYHSIVLCSICIVLLVVIIIITSALAYDYQSDK